MSTSHISEMQDKYFVERINQIYSKEIDINQFIKHTYNLLNDLIYHYKIHNFSLHSVNVLGKFISYILRNYRGLDDLNKKCIETLKQLFSNGLFSIKLKNRLMYRLELNIASNLLYKQSRIDQSTWECICIYVIHCKNIFPPIRILIFFGIYTISNPAEHTRCLHKLNYLIQTMPMYGVDFFEIVMTIKLLMDKSNSLHSKIKLFCLKIMKLIKLNMNKLDYENALRCIKPGMFYALDIDNTTDGHNTIPTIDNTVHESIILPESLNESSVYSVDSLNDYLPTHLTSESIQIIPNYICSMLHERYNIPVQLDGIKALKEYVKKRFCCENAYELFENEKHYIQGVQCLLISIFHLMNNQLAFMIVHFADVILMLLRNLPNFVIRSSVREIFSLCNVILKNNLKPVHSIMRKILIELLKHFPPNFILDELWICMKNANFRIRTNALYSVAFILRNLHDESLDLLKILQRITQCLKDRSGVVQTAAIECCAILIGLHNRNYLQNDDASLLYVIENFLLEEMPVLEVDFLLQKMKKAIQRESFKENFIDENDSLELEISERQKFSKYANSMRSVPSNMRRTVTFPAMKPHFNYIHEYGNSYSNIWSTYPDFKRSYSLDYRNPSDTVLLYRTKTTPTSAATTTTIPNNLHIYSTPTHRRDSNDIHHMMNSDSYYRISEEHKAAAKNRKPDFCDNVRRYLNKQNQQYPSDCQIIPETLPFARKASGMKTDHDKIYKRKKSINVNEINHYSTSWYNQDDDNEIGQSLETLRDSVSRKRKQWLSDQVNKLNTERTTIGCHHDDEIIYIGEGIKAENQDMPPLINTKMLDSFDTDDYITNTVNDQNVSLCNYDKNPTNTWRNYALCSANTRFCDIPETSPSYKMYRIMNDVHKPSVHTEQSKMDSNHHYDNLNKQKLSGHKKSTRYPESYQERYTSNSKIEKKIPNSRKIKKARTLSTPIEVEQFKKIEEQIIEYLTSDNWEDQNKATNIIQSLLKTMNVKPLEVIFSDIKQRSILINGIEKSIRCLRSQVCRNGLKTLHQLCDYLKCVHQGCLLDAYSTPIITTLLSRISEDSSTKFLQNEANKTLETYISCIDEVTAIQSMCTHVWESISRSNIRRNAIGKMLTYIFCNKLQTGKKNAILFKRLGSDGIERLIKVVHQLVNDKLSDTRQYGRRILERLTLIADIDEVYKKISSYENPA